MGAGFATLGGQGCGRALDRRALMSAIGARVMFGAGRRCGNSGNSSDLRTHALSRAEIESPRARGLYMAGCEFSPASVLRPPALQLKSNGSRAAYDPGKLAARRLAQSASGRERPPQGLTAHAGTPQEAFHESYGNSIGRRPRTIRPLTISQLRLCRRHHTRHGVVVRTPRSHTSRPSRGFFRPPLDGMSNLRPTMTKRP